MLLAKGRGDMPAADDRGRQWLKALGIVAALAAAPMAAAQTAPDAAPAAPSEAPAVMTAPAALDAPALPAADAPAAPAPEAPATPAPEVAAGAPAAVAPAPAAAPESATPGATDPAAADPAASGVVPGSEVVTELTEAVVPEGEATLPHDLSPWGMYQAADIVVKAVMIGLVFASLVTWTIFVAKGIEVLAAGARLNRGIRVIGDARDLASAEAAFAGRGGVPAAMVRAARYEATAAPALRSGEGMGLLARVGSHLARIEAGAGRRLSIGTGLLATIGSTAPFVGLFGTVWGIMNSFIGIAESQTTNLAVVAPGIAEALLATAIGLVAAIPAVVIYNLFARAISAYRAKLADAAAAVERLVSRDLDHGRLMAVPLPRAAE